MLRENYFIKNGYVIRPDNAFFDDTPLTDEFQDSVYRHARTVLQRNFYGSVCDIGCGSGFKLLKWFSDVPTVGIDLPPTVKWLKVAYRHRYWTDLSITDGDKQVNTCDLAIASDIIEHLPNPDLLLEFCKRSSFKMVIISTPERDLLNKGTENGPPQNVHHVREWNSAELLTYLEKVLGTVTNHFIVDGTCQVAEVKPYER